MTTFLTSAAVGEKEQLADVIYRVDPSETPAFSALKKETSNGIFTEWQVQELSSASGSNFVSEGADASITAATPTTRLGNYHQISVKTAAVSKTLENVDKAGRNSEVQYQKLLKSLELRRDIEKSITDTNQARSSSDPRKSASLITWITNGDKPSDMAFATGDGTDAADLTGTARALTLGQVENSMQAAWTDGGSPKIMLCSAANRANFSDLSASGNLVSNDVNMTAAKEVTYVGSTSVFMTDFGTLDVSPSRFMGDDKVFLIDPEFASLCTLNGRNFAENEIAPTGDADKLQIITEWALKVQAPKAHAAVIGLSGS